MKKITRNLSLFSISLFLLACGNNESPLAEENTSNSRKVETFAATPIDYEEVIFATGKLASSEESKLSFKTGGIIKKIHVKEGQQVKKGQVLAELDLSEIQAQTQQASLGQEQASINIDNAKLAVKLAERDYRNAKALYQDSVATLEQLENAEVQLENVKNQLAAAEKGLDFSRRNVTMAEFNLKYSKIIAPSNGVILRKKAEANELTSPGKVIFDFGTKDKAMVIRVNLTDKDIIHVNLGDRADVQFDAYNNHVFEGIVREIASIADPYTNTYEVEVEVVSEGKKLLSGFIGMVEIESASKTVLLEIPVDALIKANANKGEIFLAEDGKARKVPIEIHRIRGNRLLVSKGLVAQDEVIISSVGYIEEDEPILISQKQ